MIPPSFPPHQPVNNLSITRNLMNTHAKPTFSSVCDGIGCGHLAFIQAGYDCAWSAEIEPFPCDVLAHRFPSTPNIGDMTAAASLVSNLTIPATDVLIGGTPCQAFSVAGKRKGLTDARGNLALTFCALADAIDDVRSRDGKPPSVILWENVPGVFTVAGNAFGCFLGELSGSGCELQPPGDGWSNAGCVFGPRRTVAWRVLDAQFFGVAQRRRRVFVVASSGDRTRPEEILFECQGLRRDSPPSREKGKGFTYDVSPSLTGSDRGTQRAGETRGQDPVVAFAKNQLGEIRTGSVANTLNTNSNASGRNTPMVACMAHGQANAEIQVNMCPTLSCNHEAPIATYDIAHTLRGDGFDASEDGTGRGTPIIPAAASVRRLTPRECERLQGLPDDHTLIPRKGKPASACPDGPRYKGIGNGQAVPVMRWLVDRILAALTEIPAP